MKILLKLFAEFFKLALFVVGGGYAIIIAADDLFAKKLKWIKEGELIEYLPLFQMVPGLIAGNTAIYVGLKKAGRTGAAVALAAVALPSLLVISLVAYGYDMIPLENRFVEAAFLGLRSALAGIVAGTVIRGWNKSVRGIYGYAAMAAATYLIACRGMNSALVLLFGMAAGLLLEFTLGGLKGTELPKSGISFPPMGKRRLIIWTAAMVAALAAITCLYGKLFWLFAKFGLLCFGGGFVIVPLYVEEFVGEGARMLQLSNEEFGNLMAITQITPGPVSVNAATFFGFRAASFPGAVAATAGLLLPSYFLLSWALCGLENFRNSRISKGIVGGIKPITVSLMISAASVFAKMSVFGGNNGGFSPLALAISVLAAASLLSKRLGVMATIFSSAGIAVLAKLPQLLGWL